MFEAIGTTTLAGLALGAGFFVLVAFLFVSERRSRATADLDKIGKMRARREAEYSAAEKEYNQIRKKIEAGNTVLIDLIHDLGDDFIGRDKAEQQIAFDEAFKAVSAIRRATPRSRIVLVLHTLGGYARPAHMIALTLREHLKKAKGHNPRREPMVTAYVPYVAMSGGTMIALAADKICLDPTASLGPIDTLYAGFPTEAYKELIAQKGALATQDMLVMLAHEAEKYDEYAKGVAREIVNPVHKDKDKDKNFLADYLSSGRLSHSQAISPKQAKELGMNVAAKIPPAIYNLVDARIHMIQTRLEADEDGGSAASPDSDAGEDSADKAMQRAVAQTLLRGPKI